MAVEMTKAGNRCEVLDSQVSEFLAKGWQIAVSIPKPRQNSDGTWTLEKGGQSVNVLLRQIEDFEARGWRLPGKEYVQAAPPPEPEPEPEPEAPTEEPEEPEEDDDGDSEE